jgi:hypothetical protein
MSILICGDTHADYDLAKLSEGNLRQWLGDEFGQIRHLIVCGDWGVIWNGSPERVQEERKLMAFYDAMPWETLVVLGNHEGYDRIAQLPWTARHGAPVQQVSQKLFILQHGNIYTIEGRRFFAFGGGESLDRDRRVEGESWWPEEIPSQVDLDRGLVNLKAVDGNVDYVVSHTCPGAMADHMVEHAPGPWKHITFSDKGRDVTVEMLTELEAHMKQPKKWFFGHYHWDKSWNHYQCLYHELAVVMSEELQ